MEAITMVIWLGLTPGQMQAVQAAQPAVYRQDMLRVEEQHAMPAKRTSELRAKAQTQLPSSTR